MFVSNKIAPDLRSVGEVRAGGHYFSYEGPSGLRDCVLSLSLSWSPLAVPSHHSRLVTAISPLIFFTKACSLFWQTVGQPLQCSGVQCLSVRPLLFVQKTKN